MTRKPIVIIALLTSVLTVLVVAGALPQGLGVAQRGGSVAATPTPPPLQQPEAAAVPPQHGRRDISRYEKLSPVAVTENPHAARAALARARAFLLEHWRGRRLGHVVINFPGPAGTPTPSAFYVEPDSDGHWSIVLEAAGRSETFRFVEEVDVSEDGPPMLDPHAVEQQRASGSKGLHLKQSERANTGMVL